MVLQVRQYRIRWRVSPEGVGKLLCRNEQLGTILNHACSRRQLFIFFHCFSEKIRLDVSSESFSRQRIHMKKKTSLIFFERQKSKIKMSSVAFYIWLILNMRKLLRPFNRIFTRGPPSVTARITTIS